MIMSIVAGVLLAVDTLVPVGGIDVRVRIDGDTVKVDRVRWGRLGDYVSSLRRENGMLQERVDVLSRGIEVGGRMDSTRSVMYGEVDRLRKLEGELWQAKYGKLQVEKEEVEGDLRKERKRVRRWRRAVWWVGGSMFLAGAAASFGVYAKYLSR